MVFWDKYKPTRLHQWDGSLADVRTARLDGLVAYSSDKLAAQTGALAGAIITIVLRVFPLSPIRNHNLLFALIFCVGYGALLGVWRKRDINAGKNYRILNGLFRPHTLFTYFFVPLIPIFYMIVLPDINKNVAAHTDTFGGAMIVVSVFFWIGAAYDYFWELFHNYALVRMNRFNPDVINEYTLRMWIPKEEMNRVCRIDSISYKSGEVVVTGSFAEPAELKRKLALLDFVKHVTVNQVEVEEKPAS